MAARLRAWRSAFAALRRATSPEQAAAVQELLHANGLVRSAQDLPLAEVSGDIVLLLHVVSSHWQFEGNAAESVNIYSKVCQLVGHASSLLQLEFKSSAAVIVSRFLREVISLHKCTIDKNLAEAAACELYSDALNAIGQFVHASGQQLSSEEANALLLSLQPFLVYNSSALRRKGNGLEYAAFVAVGNIFIRVGSSVSDSTWQILIQVYRTVLDHVASQIVEDANASRYYAVFLRSLHFVLSDLKAPFAEHVGAFVASLRMFLAYGLPGSRLDRAPIAREAASTSGTVREADNRKSKSSLYRPPHLRAKHQDGESSQDEKRISFSDSEQSDTDTSHDGDNFRSSKARTNAVLSIHAIARADPKLLHAHWSLLLPTDNVLQPRLSQASLMTTLLFDPVLKTRIAAASAVSAMLEGPARAFLQVAEFKEAGKAGSFTTLSSSLGQIIVQLQKGLLHLISNESHGGVLTGAFKALSLLVSAAPFDRLPSWILPNIIRSIHKRLQDFSSTSDQSLQVSAFSCLNASLCASAASSEVSDMLLESSSDASQSSSLCWDLILFSRSSSTAVCIEALQALKSAIHHHGVLASQLWNAISDLVQEVVDHERTQTSTRIVDDKTVYHALKLLDESLRALSGFKGANDMYESSILPPAPSELPQPVKLVERPGELAAPKLDASGITQWRESLERTISVTLKHSTPAVRSASLTCFAGLTPNIYSALFQSHHAFIFSTVIYAAQKDEAATVRSAACRALGVIVGFVEILASQEDVGQAIATVQATISEASLPVRITSCWALANICDALCKCSERQLDQPALNDPALHKILVDIALTAAKDGDKVRANAGRALGSLARFVDFTEGSAASPWLSKLVQSLVSCITTGNVKVRWNVCHALRNLFLNKTICLRRMTWTSSVYSILLLLLRDSGNFKIRIHAATALAVPCNREDFGESYGDVVHALVHAMESLQSDQGSPSSFKYTSTLSEQLTSTCLHVLALVLPEDYTVLKDFLNKRANFLYNWLQAVHRKNSQLDAGSEMELMVSRVLRAISDVYEHGGDQSSSSRLRSLLHASAS